jgi:hypothetical protein
MGFEVVTFPDAELIRMGEKLSLFLVEDTVSFGWLCRL